MTVEAYPLAYQIPLANGMHAIVDMADARAYQVRPPRCAYQENADRSVGEDRANMMGGVAVGYRAMLAAVPQEPPASGEQRHQPFDFLAHLQRQRDWSSQTFGPGARTLGVIEHIRKELREIEADPSDVTEWIDVAILALDGAWRAGYQPQQIIDALVAKQTKNEGRIWPDWRTMPENSAIEHDRSGEQE